MAQNYSDIEHFDSSIVDGLNIAKRHSNAMIGLNDWVEREHGGQCSKFCDVKVLDIDRVVNDCKLNNVSSSDTVIGLRNGNNRSLRLVEAKFGVKKHNARELGATTLKDKYDGSTKLIRELGDVDIMISKKMDILVKKGMVEILRSRLQNLTARNRSIHFVAKDIDSFYAEYFVEKKYNNK